MLAPEARTVAFELLRPPAGHRLDLALLTTYTLDLEALLSLPLAVLAQADESLDDLIADPVRLQQGLREAAGRVHLFVDARGIAIPRTGRTLYALLESSVHPVRAPRGGIFHPKVWVARFTAVEAEAGEPPLLRVVVLSRNLTFDRAWDAALASETRPDRRRRAAASRPLHDFIEAVPKWTTEHLEPRVAEQVRNLADEVGRCRFPVPDGFEAPVKFHALGWSGRRLRPPAGSRVLAVAPFVNRTALGKIVAASGNGADNVLVSREEELDALPDDALESWQTVLVLSDAAQDEAEDAAGEQDEPEDRGGRDEPEPGGSAPDTPEDGGGAPDERDNRDGGVRPSGLHAKLIAVEHGWNVTWYVGSANLTKAALTGRNVELLAAVTGRKERRGGVSGHGIDRFLEGFRKLCAPYRRSAPNAEDSGVVDARQRIEEARGLLVDADLRVTCSPDGDDWRWAVDGDVELPADVTAAVWPVSLAETRARPFGATGVPPVWTLRITQLTAFVAFHLRVAISGVDDVRMTLKLPADGLPEESERMHHVLATLIDSPQRFLQFLRALLGGLDRLTDWERDEGGETGSGAWATSLAGETILDDLLRAASRKPASLKPARRLIGDLRKTEHGRRIVPDDLFAVWTAVEEALQKDRRS